jgi:hypothetical protein
MLFSRQSIKTVVVLVTLAGARAAAQCTPGGPANPPAVQRAIVGIVLDTAHHALDNVSVVVKKPRRQARTGADGRFKLPDLDPGTYELTVHRLGYEITVASYVVTDTGGVARFCMIPEARGLAAMVTSAKRGGLGGIVGDSTYKMLPGAKVYAVSAGQYATTDSAGGFYLPLKPGTYAVQVSKEGFGKQILSVTVPRDSGRQVAVWLTSPSPYAKRLAVSLEEMRGRLIRANSQYASLVSSEEIAKFTTDLAGVAQTKSKGPIADDCEAVIDGGPASLPLYMIDKSDVALMEVYLPRMKRGGATSILSGSTRAPTSVGGGLGPTWCRPGTRVYVWMKP